jgi:diguanylate cyclase (GGDEF)-like protein
LKEKSKILIIDDDESTRKSLALIFRKNGYEAEDAENGKEALSKAEKSYFNVALLDIRLPDMEGTELLTPLKEIHPDMEVIVMTGYASMENTIESLNGGASAYFTKPLKLNEVLATIRKMLKKQFQEIEKRRSYQEMEQKLCQSKQEEEQLIYLATHDALTGLPNRMLFNDRLSMELVRARRNRQKLAVMLLDLDHFKDINDKLGHHVGDRLLQLFGQRLTNLLRKSDSVARIGGDEFLLLLPEIKRVKEAAKIAQKVLEAARRPFRCSGGRIKISASLGISIFPNDNINTENLIKNADIAVYRAKEEGGDRYKFCSTKKGRNGRSSLHSESKKQYRLVQERVPPFLRSRLGVEIR